MGRALQLPSGISRLVERGLEAAWAPGTAEEKRLRLVRKRRSEVAWLSWYLLLSIGLLVWHHLDLALTFVTIAGLTAISLYGSVGELRKLEKSS